MSKDIVVKDPKSRITICIGADSELEFQLFKSEKILNNRKSVKICGKGVQGLKEVIEDDRYKIEDHAEDALLIVSAHGSRDGTIDHVKLMDLVEISEKNYMKEIEYII